MKKHLLLRTIITTFAIVLLYSGFAFAGADSTPPEVNSIKVVSNPVTRPGIAKIEFGFVEEDTGVKSISGQLMHVNTLGEYGDFQHTNDQCLGFHIDFDKPLYSGRHTITLPISEEAKEGQWVFELSIEDNAGNRNYYFSEYNNGKLFDGKFFFYDSDGSIWNESGPDVPLTTYEPLVLVDEFPNADEFSVTNPKIVERLNNLDEGSAARILMKGSSVLPKEAFSAIKGKNKTIVAISDQYRWVFNGLDITAPKDIDTTIKIETSSGMDFSNDKSIVKVAFKNNGTLPGKATIRMKSDYLYSLNSIKGTLRLYHLLEDGMTVIEENHPNFDLVFDGTDKWCYFDITHNSTFIISSGIIKNKLITYSGNHYNILSRKDKTVALIKSKNKASVAVPSTIKLNGKSYKVTQINANAFKGSKIRTVTIGKNVKGMKKNAFKNSKATKLIIRTKLLKKTTIKGSLKGSKIKTIQVKVGSKKLNKKYAKKYRQLFTKATAGKKVPVK